MHSGRKIRVAQKNVIEEKLLEIKRSSYKERYVYVFSRFVLGFIVNNYQIARSNSMAFVTNQLVTLGMIEQPVWL